MNTSRPLISVFAGRLRIRWLLSPRAETEGANPWPQLYAFRSHCSRRSPPLTQPARPAVPKFRIWVIFSHTPARRTIVCTLGIVIVFSRDVRIIHDSGPRTVSTHIHLTYFHIRRTAISCDTRSPSERVSVCYSFPFLSIRFSVSRNSVEKKKNGHNDRFSRNTTRGLPEVRNFR